MGQVIDFLSGGVPGGILVLLLLLLIINLVLFFFKSSKLISAYQARKNQFRYSLVLFLLYTAIWLVTQPPKPQIRIVVLPAISSENQFRLTSQSLEFAEIFKREAAQSLSEKYFLHPWEWQYETITMDSVLNVNQWKLIAKRLNAGMILQPVTQSDGLGCTVYLQDDSVQFHSNDFYDLLTQLNSKFEIFKSNSFVNTKIDLRYIEGRLGILNQNYEKVIQLNPDGSSMELQALKAEALVRRGLAVSIDRAKAQYFNTENPDFDQAKDILFKSIQNQQDTYETAYWLGRIAVYDQDYTKAELFLKKALVDNPSDSRIYLALGYLYFDRLTELGYSDRSEILKKAVELDPGYREAVYQLADTYYNSGTGTVSGLGTTRARQVINAFLKIQKNDLKILSLLASLELKLGYHNRALEIYTRIAQQSPEESNSYYNLGMVYFYKENYQKALDCFLKAIAMDENLDAYLYAGITYRTMGENQLALNYYRERIRRKIGDDDRWAREAMKGIRKILADTTVKNVH